MRKLKFVIFLTMLTLLATFPLTAQAATPVDLTARIDATGQFWSSFYSTAYGDEETITIYRIKSVVIEIRSGAKVLDSFTFTKDSDQSHRFAFSTSEPDIVVAYRASTFSDRQFNFTFDYHAGQTLLITSNTTPLVVKTPYFAFTK